MDSQIKHAYSAPRLVEYGRVEDVTRDWGSGGNDFSFFGHDDGDDGGDDHKHRHGHTSS